MAFWQAVTGRADERHAGGRSGRDAADLNQFAARTQAHRWLDAEGLAVLEPDLGGRFARALFFEGEAHLDRAGRLAISLRRIEADGGRVRFNASLDPTT